MATDLSDVMDEIASTISAYDWEAIGVTKPHVYAYPAGNIQTPAIVVGYPEEIDYAFVFKGGTASYTLPTYVMVGSASDKQTRDVLGTYVSLMPDVIADIETAHVQTSVASKARIEKVTVNAVEYIALVFDFDIIS